MSQFLSVSFEHAHPSADEIRIAAYRCAMDAGEKGVCLVQAKVLDHAAPINVVVNIAAGEATVVLSLPKQIHAFPFGWAYYFESGVYLVTEQPAEAVSKDVRSSVSDTDPLYLLALDQESAFVTTMLCLPDALRPVPRTVEGAAAAAMYLHRDLEHGTMEVTVGQAGGILEIGMRKESGEVTGLSAGGPVEVSV